MSYTRTAPAGLVYVGDQAISMSGTAVYTLNSTVSGSRLLCVTVETSNVRWRYGGGDPAASTGNLLFSTAVEPIWLSWNGTSLLKFTAANSTAPSMFITGFKYAGDV